MQNFFSSIAAKEEAAASKSRNNKKALRVYFKPQHVFDMLREFGGMTTSELLERKARGNKHKMEEVVRDLGLEQVRLYISRVEIQQF